MTLENTTTAAPDTSAAAAPVVDTTDADLGAVWDKFERDNGAERDGGKFASPDPAKKPDVAATAGDGKGEERTGGGLTPDAGSAPLPDNWKGIQGADAIKDAWAKAPAEVRSFVAAREQELQQRLSDHGRQLSGWWRRQTRHVCLRRWTKQRRGRLGIVRRCGQSARRLWRCWNRQ
jgi:hypothetical protein